jgi:hypothetical protein
VFLCWRSLLSILNCGDVAELELIRLGDAKMLVYERELVEQANAELLRQIEERLAHSREVIGQINEVLTQRHARRALGLVASAL